MRISLFQRAGLGPLAISVAAALGVLCSCVSDSNVKKPVPSLETGGQSITEINLLAIPVALNFDQTPGPDGFVIKVFGNTRKRPKPQPIDSGTIEVLMFDGIPGMPDGPSLQPMRIWSYSARELKAFEVHGSVGTGYQLAPRWGDAKPTSNRISVVVRYTAPSGASVASAPSVISVATK